VVRWIARWAMDGSGGAAIRHPAVGGKDLRDLWIPHRLTSEDSTGTRKPTHERAAANVAIAASRCSTRHLRGVPVGALRSSARWRGRFDGRLRRVPDGANRRVPLEP
jgi:hypothetical protein